MPSNPGTTPAPRPRRPRRWFRRLALASLALVVLLVAAHVTWTWWERRQLATEAAALRAAGEPLAPEDLPPSNVGPEDNAVTDYLAAAATIDEHAPAWRAWNEAASANLVDGTAPPATDEVRLMRAVAEANRPALDRAAVARGRSGVDWNVTFARPLATADTPDLKGPRRLADLLRCAAVDAHAAGRDDLALAHVRDLVRLSHAIERYPSLIGHLVALGAASVASDAAAQLAPDLRIGSGSGDAPRGTVADVIAALLDDRPANAGLRLAWQCERMRQYAAAQFLTAKHVPADRRDLELPLGRAPFGVVLAPAFHGEGRRMLRYMDQAIRATDAAADLPFSVSRAGERGLSVPRASPASPPRAGTVPSSVGQTFLSVTGGRSGGHSCPPEAARSPASHAEPARDRQECLPHRRGESQG